MSKFLKIFIYFIIAFILVYVLGQLAITNIWIIKSRALLSGYIGSLIQLILICVLTYFYPKFIFWKVNKTLKRDGIKFEHLNHENREMIIKLSHRWVCLSLLLVLFVLDTLLLSLYL
jgi:hypothetical protein